MIRVEHVTKYYGDFKALDDINFEIGEGQVVGFLGPNGAGKTTTLKLLTCNAFPHAGKISIAGFDVMEHAQEVQARIGYLPESAPLYRDMLVWEYLDFMGEARGMNPGERRQAIERVAEMTGISERLGQLIGELSKGYRQRVGLAQAILHEPEVLILDEPYTGLDPLQIIEIRNLVKEYGREHTVFLSSHILQEVEATADRVIIINSGRIVADGLVRQLMGHDTLVAHVQGPASMVLDALGKVKGASIVGDMVTDDGIEVRLSVQDSSIDDVAARIFDVVKERDWRLLRLEPGRMTFEELFIRLTRDEEAVDSDSDASEESTGEEKNRSAKNESSDAANDDSDISPDDGEDEKSGSSVEEGTESEDTQDKE